MPTGDGHGLRYVCALVVILVFPLSLAIPPTTILFIFGIAAVYWLWFARSFLLLAAAAILAGVLVYLVAGIGKTQAYLIGMMVPAISMAYIRYRGSSVPTALSVGAAFPILGIAFYHNYFANLMAFVSAEFRRQVVSQPLMPLSSPQDQSLIVERLTHLADNYLYYFPASALCFILATYLLGIAAGNLAVRRSGIFALKIGEFSLWKMPEWSIIPLGIAAIFVLTEVTLLNVIGWNALFLYFVLYSIFGLAIVEYYLRVKRFPVLARAVIYMSLFVLQVVAAVILPLVALLDAKFDFRKVRAKRLG